VTANLRLAAILSTRIAVVREPAYCGMDDRFGSRLCENAQEPTRRRIIFSIASFPIAATELFFFGMMKSRKTFYV